MGRPSDETIGEVYERIHSTRRTGEILGVPKSTVFDALVRLRNKVVNPDFTDIPVVEGDCVVVGDVHLPTTDFDFAARVSIVGDAKLRGKVPKTLVICGDLINADAVSDYPDTVPANDLGMELDLAKETLAAWGQVFGRIVFTMGNHERRLLKKLMGMLNTRNISDLFGGNVEVYRASSVKIISGGVEWRAVHPSNYSRIPGKTGDTLAQKYQCNVIVHHEHHVGIRRDSYGRYTIVNNGGLHNSNAMWYVHEFDNTAPVMQNSFALVKNGHVSLWTPYDTMTDWSVLGDVFE